MKKQLINEAFRLQQLAGLKPINSLNENDHAYDTLMDAVDQLFKPGSLEHKKLANAVEKALDNSELEVHQYDVPDAYGQVEKIAKEIGLLNNISENESESKNYVMKIESDSNLVNIPDYVVLGKVGELNIEDRLNKFISKKKAEYLQDDDSDPEYAEEFFNWSKENLYGEEIYQGQFGEENIFDVYEIPSDVTDYDEWVNNNIITK